MRKTKEELLANYAKREPQLFLQYDNFDDGESFRSVTEELMHGSCVRILINPATAKEDVLRMLAELTEFVKDDFDNAMQHGQDIYGTIPSPWWEEKT